MRRPLRFIGALLTTFAILVTPVTVQSQPAPHELTVAIARHIRQTWTPTLGMFPSVGIYENLVRADENLQLQPELATSWSYQGNNTWRFVLRQGVRFHDGQAFNAQAAKASLDRVASWPSFNTLGLTNDSLKVVDDYTLDVNSPISLRVPEVLSHRYYGITAPGVDAFTHPVGTGPFRFVEYVTDQQMTVERNPDYWGTLPMLDRIVFREMPDENSRLLALQAGEVDVVPSITPGTAAEMSRAPAPGVKLVASGPCCYRTYEFATHGNPPYDLLQDINLRRAITMSIDRQALIDAFWPGVAEPNQTLVPYTVLGASASKIHGPVYDSTGAMKLLDDSGWVVGADGIREKNGRKLQLQLNVSPTEPTAVPEAVQVMLRQVGIDARLDIVPDQAADDARLEAGKGDIWWDAGAMTIPDPCVFCYLFVSPGYPGGSIQYNRIHSVGPSYDAAQAAALQAPDISDTQSWTAEAMRIAIDDSAVIFPLATLYGLYGVRDGVQITPHPSWPNTNWGTASGRP